MTRYWPQLLRAWGLAALVIALTTGAAWWRRDFPDSDDAMRLLEVRDLLAGQSWWDVGQHRLVAGAMHWSRLVDLPIAAVQRPLLLFLPQAIAEHIALGVVPLLTLLVVMALVAVITRRLLDAEHAGYALLLAPLSVPLVYQLRPMRIDHHGWQVACALAALAALLGRRADLRSGLLAGAALAALLTISLEGLPIAAALLGLAALGWAFDPSRRAQFAGATGGTFVVALLLHAATRGPAFLTPACDAMAPVWLAALGIAAVGVTGAIYIDHPLPRQRPGPSRDAVETARSAIAGVPHLGPGLRRGGAASPLVARLVMLGAIGTAALATLWLVDPACLRGPFGHLDPVVRTLWYENTPEGLPIWRQAPVWAVMMIGLPLVGLIGAVQALRAAAPADRAAWRLLLGAALAALLLSLLVARSAATANAFALPGAAYLVLGLLRRARRIPRTLPRLAATTGAVALAAPGLAAIPLLGMPEPEPSSGTLRRLAHPARPACHAMRDALALAELPPALLFAPIDLTPEIVAGTRHHAITGGYHRNRAAIRDVMLAFTASPDRARATVTRYRAAYVVGCPTSPETEIYQDVAPNGLWAQLERGGKIAWLQPVPIHGSPVLAWRVLPSEPARR